MNSKLEGGCACGSVRYELHGAPMIVHACHCTDCRRLSGGAYAINAWTEADKVELTSGELSTTRLPGGESGKPCDTWFCSGCGTILWSRYHASPGNPRFVKVGTLDDPAALPPDVHIWTQSKLPSVRLPEDVPAFEQFYNVKEVWSADSLQRLRAMMADGKPA